MTEQAVQLPRIGYTSVQVAIVCPVHGRQVVLVPGRDGLPALEVGAEKCPLCRDQRDIDHLNEDVDRQNREFLLELRMCGQRAAQFWIEDYRLEIPREQVRSWIRKQVRRWNRDNPATPRRCTMYRINHGPWLSTGAGS